MDEVFAPTSSFGARRALLAVAAAKGLEIHQVDIKTAFLNGELEEDVYVTQPPGFENGDPRVVCKLKKALYGLKQSPRAWHKTLNEKLITMGYTVCKSDAGVYVKTLPNGEKAYVLVYVDDYNDVGERRGSRQETVRWFASIDLLQAGASLASYIPRTEPARILERESSNPRARILEPESSNSNVGLCGYIQASRAV